MNVYLEILKQYWGHADFRFLQEDIILSVAEGNDTLALLPTSGGKSVCYQVPAMAKEGLCIVVSPLIALMNDQVQSLQQKGIRALAITSSMNFQEIESAFNNVIYNDYKFLYVSPERIQSKLFLRKLSAMKVNLVAVDESHCISQWGYDFRPSYLQIKMIREVLPEVPILALTATATKKTAEDIVSKLEFHKGYRVFRSSFFRQNLRYKIRMEDDKLRYLLNTLKHIKESSIIYTRNRRSTQEISDYLNAHGIESAFYHAGLSPEERAGRQSDWLHNKKKVMVSTNAFGMGIDKPDVRLVVHTDLPDSLEAWYQEAGRAGRDGRDAEALVLFNQSDIDKLERQLETAFPSLGEIKQVYVSICNFYRIATGAGEGLSLSFNLEQVAAQFKLSPSLVYNAIKFLEKENYLTFADVAYQPSRLHLLIAPAELYNFRVQNPAMDHFILVLLRTYSDLFSAYVNLDEFKLARAAKLSQPEVVKNLEKLHKLQLADYIPKSGLPRIVFTRERIDSTFFTISKEHYEELKKQAHKRIESVIDFVTDKHLCRNRKILLYFDETDFEDCHTCDNCLRKEKTGTSELSSLMKQQILNLLDHRTYPLEELVSLLYHYKKEEVIDCINSLIEDEELIINEAKIVSHA